MLGLTLMPELSAAARFFAVLLPGVGDVLPLHVRSVIWATGAQRLNVVDHVAGAGSAAQARRRAGVLALKGGALRRVSVAGRGVQCKAREERAQGSAPAAQCFFSQRHTWSNRRLSASAAGTCRIRPRVESAGSASMLSRYHKPARARLSAGAWHSTFVG